ncbi:MAG: hypothetical protein COB07_03820 [Sulfurovum sp.]|nr:MAG: hypothetical protein COB07_03820 [Sulfurovum sp.]
MSRPMFPLIVAIFTIATLLIASFLFKIYEYPLWIKEGGIIETLTVVGYFSCVVFILLKGGWSYIKKYNYFFILIILFGLRELDFDKRFTTMGIFKSKFYVSSSVPVIEKFMGLLVIMVLLYIIVSIVKNHSKGFFAKIKQLSPVHLGVLITFLTIVFSKSIDGIARKLGYLNIIMDDQTSEHFEVVEEVLELGIPLLILATLFIYFSKKVRFPKRD